MKRILITAITCIFCLSCSSQSNLSGASTSPVEKNKAVVASYLEALGTADIERVSEAVLASNHRQLRGEFENLKYNADGDSGLTAGSLPMNQAIADRTNTITALIGEGDTVAARIRVQGTHVGRLYGVPATNKEFWFDEIAIFKLADGKITQSWHLANDGRFLIQVGERLPARADGRIIVPPYEVEAYPGDHWVAKLSDGDISPQDRNKITVAQYNADRFRGGRTTPIPSIYDEYLHSGNQVTVDLMREIERVTGQKVPGSFPAAWSGRSDLLVNMIAEGNIMIMQFQLNALNAGPLYTIPATGKQIRSWEVLVAEFDDDGKWRSAWWFGDDLGLYLKLGSEEALSFFFDDVSIPR